MAVEAAQRRPRIYTKHGVTSLKRSIRVLGARAIDQRTSVGKALAAWRTELLADLGGIENVTTQELALVEEAVKTKLILDSVDAWLLSQPSLINKRTRSALPVVRDRQALVATLRGLLGDLGLQRRTKALPALAEYLRDRPSGPSASSATLRDGPEAPDDTADGAAGAVRSTVRKRSSAGAGPDGVDGADGDSTALSGHPIGLGGES